jgi:hypothetical protein
VIGGVHIDVVLFHGESVRHFVPRLVTTGLTGHGYSEIRTGPGTAHIRLTPSPTWDAPVDVRITPCADVWSPMG